MAASSPALTHFSGSGVARQFDCSASRWPLPLKQSAPPLFNFLARQIAANELLVRFSQDTLIKRQSLRDCLRIPAVQPLIKRILSRGIEPAFLQIAKEPPEHRHW